MDLAEITCKNCGRPIARGDLNLEHALASCSACHSVFSFAHWAPRADANAAVAARGRVEMPSGFSIDELGGEFVLRRRWFHPALFFLLFFCIAWNSFLIGWYAVLGGMFGDLMDGGPGAIFGLVFPLGHVAVGVMSTYTVVAGFLNTTTIRIAGGELTVTHGPIPWGGPKSAATSDVDQLFCQAKTKVGKSGAMQNFNYQVQALRKDGTKVKLLGQLTDVDQALFIEQTLEDRLGLADRRVAGELAP